MDGGYSPPLTCFSYMAPRALKLSFQDLGGGGILSRRRTKAREGAREALLVVVQGHELITSVGEGRCDRAGWWCG